ncbi:PEP/pyruvate-binding domain-containing protein [Chondromyces crocatus]|uniref:Phosphoenolpyruvate synthase n=1 Tax=Chondromyces crocatus TaxID=52 RepID=A0A0K1E8D5_CHOCO|nr:PEP/pyruvate-binding domain-containing protein [Chondromyces crocatus]AKT37109.1 uncharacterized protein CMC5_012370 [Chondromyces crocatus]
MDTQTSRGAPHGTSPAAPQLVLSLHEIDRGDLAIAGGKGESLGALTRAGFRVPEGFVVTTTAYDRFVEQGDLAPHIERVLRDTPEHGEALRSVFEAAPIPADVATAIEQAYQKLGAQPLAVRSSATAEDLPQAAFAGQQDTFLNVVGLAAVLTAVRRCWASLWTDRAIAYRARQGLERAPVKMAVVLQRMAPAEVAGVLFTANPVTGARDETVIDANPGLGEAVVSGLVTPDHFVLRKRLFGFRIVERRLGRRELVVRARVEGGVEHVTPAPLHESAPRASLPDASLRALARLGARVAQHFGAPQDIEWAVVAGEPWLLQARPITALPEPTERPKKTPDNPIAYFADMLSVRPYPMDLSTWGPGIYDAVLRSFSHLGVTGTRFADTFVEEDSVILQIRDDTKYRLSPRVLLAPAWFLWHCARHNPLHWRALPALHEARERARVLESRDLGALAWDELVATIHEALKLPWPLLGEARRRYYPRAMLAFGLLQLALWLVEHEDRLDALLSGIDTKTLSANRALAALADTIRNTPALAETFAQHPPEALWSALEAHDAGRTFLADVRAFLDHYGHREAVMFAVLEPTWKDAPAVVLGMLETLAANAPQPDTAQLSWEAARDEILAHPFLAPAPLRAAFTEILAEARALTEIREDTHFYGTLPMPILRRVLLELGRRLTDAAVLSAPEDIFHLRLDEVERVQGVLPPPAQLTAELSALVERRRARRAALAGSPVVDPRLYRRTAAGADALVSGVSGSAGVVEGPVRVILSPADFSKIQQGDVLVAPFTNPAWTPVFQRLAAIVVDSGAAGSHAAIVAREYGIPAVMGAGDATRRLKDGERVRVDGNRGVVLPARAPEPPKSASAHPEEAVS